MKGRGPYGAWADGGKCITLDLAIGSTSAEVVVLGRRVDLACQRGRWWQGYYGVGGDSGRGRVQEIDRAVEQIGRVGRLSVR